MTPHLVFFCRFCASVAFVAVVVAGSFDLLFRIGVCGLTGYETTG